MELVIFLGAAIIAALFVMWWSRRARSDEVSAMSKAPGDRPAVEFSASAPLLQTGTSAGPGRPDRRNARAGGGPSD